MVKWFMKFEISLTNIGDNKRLFLKFQDGIVLSVKKSNSTRAKVLDFRKPFGNLQMKLTKEKRQNLYALEKN